MTEPVPPARGERVARWILAIAVLLLIVVLAGYVIKVPYAVERPGPATDTLGTLSDGSELVSVEGTRTYPTKGSLYFTTVRVLGGPERHITGWEWTLGHLDGDSRVLPEEQVFPPNTTEEQIQERNAAQMQGSQKDSIAVGIRSTGAKVDQTNIVAQVGDGLPADGKLEVDDDILTVDGRSTRYVEDVVEAIADRSPGDDVELGIRRDGAKKSVTITTTDIGGGRAGIGIGIDAKYDYPFEVRIDAGNVGGPSAGMMFALAVHDVLTPGPLTGGQKVAGTGTISDSGVVGPIGGVAQKMVGARDTGAQWFLTPQTNCDEVVGNVPDGLTVIPVEDFDEARTTVESIAKGETADFPTCEDANNVG